MLHIATTALEELHSVKKKASVRMPPALVCPNLDDLFGDDVGDVFRRDALEQRDDLPIRFSIGKKLAIESSASSAGKSAKKK